MTVHPDEPAQVARVEAAVMPWTESELSPTLERVRPYTIIGDASLLDLARQVVAVLALGIPGDFVECGVFRGGASFLMADLLRQAGVRDRKIWLFDSFEGMPPAEEIDGAAARAWESDTEGPWYFNNVTASLEEVRQGAVRLGLTPYVEFVKGWFDQSLPVHRARVGPIALLRLDCDWYASVRSCLDNLYDQVADGGFVVLDDYYSFEGCAIAMHEFLGERKLPHRIETVMGGPHTSRYCQSAVLRKGGDTWTRVQQHVQWQQTVELAMRDIAEVVPQGSVLLLVDQQELAGQPVSGRRTRPFLERDGVDWGPPADDETAVREIERMRTEGASHIVFAWPAFWWLKHYAVFASHLRTRFPLVLANERVIVYDLRKEVAADGPAVLTHRP
jgi:O-methyltransferase